MRIHLRDLPTRLATGAYILHSGLEKWHGTEEQARGVHGAAAGAFPFFARVPPRTFLKALALAEIGLGATLLTPVVLNSLAGAALSTFAGGLMTMYVRTPTMRKPHSVWPTPVGVAVSKDVWMLGIGLGLMSDGLPFDRTDPSLRARTHPNRGGLSG